MAGCAHAKLRGTCGIARLVVILALLAVVLLTAILIPVIRSYSFRADALGCLAALDTARRQLAAEFLIEGENKSAGEARDYVGYVMAGWDDLCPGGGTVYIVQRDDSDLDWDVVCGLHGADRKLCTRLNADYVLQQLRENLRTSRLAGTPYPGELKAMLHHCEMKAVLAERDTGVRRGTDATIGVKGTVIAYGIAGYGEFGTDSGTPEGELCWFSYADEEHCANWSAWDGWTGDSYAASP